MLSFPQGTEMFQFPWFPLPALCVQTGVTPHDGCRVSPFGHPRINARSTASRGFSQSPTSFIGSRRQGIHRWLFVAWKNKFFYGDRLGGSLQRCSCSLCNSQGAPRAECAPDGDASGRRPLNGSPASRQKKQGCSFEQGRSLKTEERGQARTVDRRRRGGRQQGALPAARVVGDRRVRAD